MTSQSFWLLVLAFAKEIRFSILLIIFLLVDRILFLMQITENNTSKPTRTLSSKKTQEIQRFILHNIIFALHFCETFYKEKKIKLLQLFINFFQLSRVQFSRVWRFSCSRNIVAFVSCSVSEFTLYKRSWRHLSADTEIWFSVKQIRFPLEFSQCFPSVLLSIPFLTLFFLLQPSSFPCFPF